MRDEIERKVRDAVGLNGFSEDDDQPIEVVPDLVIVERAAEPAAKAAAKDDA